MACATCGRRDTVMRWPLDDDTQRHPELLWAASVEDAYTLLGALGWSFTPVTGGTLATCPHHRRRTPDTAPPQ